MLGQVLVPREGLAFHLHEDTLRQVLEDDLWLCTALYKRCIFFVKFPATHSTTSLIIDPMLLEFLLPRSVVGLI